MTHARPAQRLLLLAAVGGTALLLAAETAPAQSGRRMMVMDNGSGPIHISMPDLRDLREPDYVRADLPVFEKKLRLDAAQRETVSTLLDGYLDAFRLLVAEHLPSSGPGGVAFLGGPGMHGVPGNVEVHEGPEHDAGGGVFVAAPGEGHDIGDWNVDLEGPGQVMITIEAGAGGSVDEDVDVTGEAGGAPEASVSIAVETADGEELPEEVRKKLEQRQQELAEQLRERLENAEPGDEIEIDAMPPLARMEERKAFYEDLAASAEVLEGEKRRLRGRFVGQVQGELTDEQLERWPSLERTLTRRKTLPKGRLDGERTDLIEVAEVAAPEALGAAPVAEQLETYELVLHDALVRRNAFLDEANRRVDGALRAREPGKALAAIDRATQLRIAVRDVNRQFTETIAALLDETAGADFRAEVLARSYPRVYRQTPGLRTFEAARQLDGLAEETLLEILEVESRFRVELDAVNDRLRRAIDAHQPGEPRRAIEQMTGAMRGDAVAIDLAPAESPVRDAFDRRAALEARYVASLHALLTPKQVAELPKLPSRRREPFIFETTTGPPLD